MVMCLLLVNSTIARAGDSPHRSDEIQRVADRIDQLITHRWEIEQIQPAGPADDAEFLRRVWLDIAGRIPPAADVLDFLEDDSPMKRRQAVDDLLSGPNYVLNFTNFWRTVMLPEVDSNFNARFLTPGFEAWLRTRLIDDTHCDELVREILTASISGSNQFNAPAGTPVAFYQAKEVKPENLAAATSRMFLGVRIECAQCHDHPFDHWKRKDFWGYAAFFASIQRRPVRGNNGFLGAIQELFNKRTLKIPDSNEVAEPTFLDGESPEIPATLSPRTKLAEWMTTKENPYFARTAVNRIWGHFFGIGIVDPVDDFSANNPPSHPELLDFLATELAGHDFDLKFLIRAIMRSRTYQLTSRNFATQEDPPERLFARMPIKGMTAEQLYDSLSQAIGSPSQFDPSRNAAFQMTPRRQFVDEFSDNASAPTERQKSVLQALAIMNGNVVSDATKWQKSITLRSIVDFPGFDTRRRIETMFVATLSRKPSSEELNRFVAYVGTGEGSDEMSKRFPMKKSPYKTAMGDVFWALLNSNEFSLNH
jgi:hypothetical protein